MRAAVRRLTWILISLGLMTVLAFGLLARLIPEQHRPHELPLFFNAEPRNVRDLSLAVFARLTKDPDSTAAAAELARLGGAALPFVMPELERLEPELRQRIALAMKPIALRMGTAAPEELTNGEQALQFWTRFWQDRSVDFRETVAKRLVERLSQRSLALRREDVLELDTYALAPLMDALGKVESEEDVKRAQRLTSVLEHIAGQPFVVNPGAGVEEARRVVLSWRRWWEDHGADYTPLDGPHRILAMVRETAYGRWLSSVLRGEIGRLRDGGTGFDLLRRSAPETLPTFFGVLLLGALLGAAGAALLSAAPPRLPGLVGASALLVAGTPMVAVFAHGGASAGAALLLVVLALAEAARVGLLVRQSPAFDDSLRAVARFRLALGLAAALIGPSAAFVASAVLGGECALGLTGLGSALRTAIARADLHAAMAVSLGLSFAGALVLLVTDALRALLAAGGRRLP